MPQPWEARYRKTHWDGYSIYTFIWILRCDSRSDYVTPRRRALLRLVEVYLRHTPRWLAVQQADVFDLVEGQPHGYLMAWKHKDY